MTVGTILLWLLAALVAAVILLVGYFVVQTRRIAAKAERLVPPAGKFVAIGGENIHYVEAGEGRPIVLIHGLGAQLHQFKSTIFDGLSRDFRVIALDRPGAGYSSMAYSASGRVTDQARIVAQFIEALGLDRPLVVGHSLGGAVALALALDHPDRISGLALIAPLTRHRSTVSPDFAGLYIKSPLRRWLLAHTVSVPMALRYAEVALGHVFHPQTVGADYMTAGGGWLGLRPIAIFSTCTDFVALEKDMPALEKRVGEIKTPVGVLFGTADKVLDFELDGASMRARLPSVDFERLEGFGHMLQFVAPVETQSFVRRIAARAFGPATAEGRGA